MELAGLFFLFVMVSLTLKAMFRICSEWERKVVLRLGRFAGVRGPGIFWLIPYLETTPYTIDMRTVTSQVTAEQSLTKDNVPVNVDTIVYWRVMDPKRAALEVIDYNAAVIGAAQTALRDIIGQKSLSEVLGDRSGLDHALTQVLDAQTEPWGVKVTSVQMRDIKIPDVLQHAMSLVAQADREVQARKMLGQSEVIIAEQFAQASHLYKDNPMALQLRGMNMLYEVMKQGGTSTIIVPAHAVESMSFGAMSSYAALGKTYGTELVETPQAE
jgi:regulator of protease activity HflC (stomatin/prohibitin superfamily)